MKLTKQAIEALAELIRKEHEIYYDFFKENQGSDRGGGDSAEYSDEKTSTDFSIYVDQLLSNVIKFEEETVNSYVPDGPVQMFLQEKQTKSRKKIDRIKKTIYDDVKMRKTSRCKLVYDSFSSYRDNSIMLKQLFGTTDLNTFFEKAQEQNEVWREEKRTLIEHPFLRYLPKEQKRWFETEMCHLILGYLLDEKQMFLRLSVPQSQELSLNSFFTVNRKTIPATELIINQDKSLYEVKVSDTLTMLIPTVGTQKGNQEIDLYRLLDSTDWSLINKILSFIDQNFFADRLIQVSLSDLAKVVAGKQRPSERHYSEVKNRLKYISTISWQKATGDSVGNTIAVSPLFTYREQEDQKGSIFYNFLLGDVLYDDICNNRVININQRALSLLTNKAAKQLLTVFQNERVNLYSKDPEQKDRTKIYDIAFFRTRFILSRKQYQKNVELIEKALQDFVKHDVVLESYQFLIGEKIKITFKPLTQQEIADLNYFEDTFSDVFSNLKA